MVRSAHAGECGDDEMWRSPSSDEVLIHFIGEDEEIVL